MIFCKGRVAMVNAFDPEAQQAINGNTQATFSNYRIRFINPDVAVADALLTVHNVNGSDGTIIRVIPINFSRARVRLKEVIKTASGKREAIRARQVPATLFPRRKRRQCTSHPNPRKPEHGRGLSR
jgi:hypothetical protein